MNSQKKVTVAAKSIQSFQNECQLLDTKQQSCFSSYNSNEQCEIKSDLCLLYTFDNHSLAFHHESAWDCDIFGVN